jgi:translocation and assembly module TamA
MKYFNLSFFFVLIILNSCAHHERSTQLCPKVNLHSPDKIEFDDTEKRLLCGDTEEPAYKNIPAYQAKFSMQGFLQSKGYSKPEFKTEMVKGEEVLNVYTGTQTKLTNVKVNSERVVDSEKLQTNIFKHYRKEVLTPKLLDDMEKEAVKFLRDQGYPCAKLVSKVNADDGSLTIDVSDLNGFTYGEIPKEEIAGVDERALARFYPFKSTDSFTQSGLDLTEKRFTRSGVVQGTFFQEKCDLKNDSFSMTQQFIVGPPRTIRFGAGASTEVGPMVRVKWSNQRYGSMASLLEASFQSSLKTQTLKFSADRYFWPDHPRQSVLAEFAVERNDQKDFRELGSTLKPQMQWSNDTVDRNWIWTTGPNFLLGSYKSKALNENRKYHTVALVGSIETKNHEYEIFDDHPEAGNFMQFNFDVRHPALGFSDPLFKLDYTFLKLLWLGNLGKGSAIAGLRINTGTTIIKSDVAPETLPPSVKYYGGGSDDVRGFELASLPSNNGAGALSKFSTKLEFRKTHLFDAKFEGFTFIDSAWFGDHSIKVNKQLWYSPGAGVRWFSPIGMVQTYLARSLSTEAPRDDGMFFYLGIGGIF